MELSNGFLNLELKTSKTHNKHNSLIIPREIMEKINFNIFESNEVKNFSQKFLGKRFFK